MSMVNADSVQLFAMLKKMQDSISSIETTKKSVKMKYEQLGAGWQDKKYNELGVVVRDCNKALNDILVIMLQAEKYVALLAKSLSEYESVQLGSTNGISASTPQTSSFAVTPSSADTTTFESNTFGSNLAFVQDRLSAERYFSRGNHYEEYRDYWENGNYSLSAFQSQPGSISEAYLPYGTAGSGGQLSAPSALPHQCPSPSFP